MGNNIRVKCKLVNLDIKDYISSGLLESYVVGDVSEDTRREIERNLGRYPELRAELSRIERSREARLTQTRESLHSSPRSPITGRPQSPGPMTRVRNLNPESSVLFWRIATAAAVLLALSASYFAVYFRSTLEESQTALHEERERNQLLAVEIDKVSERLERVSGTLDLLDDPSYTRVFLTGTEESPNARVTVFWNPRSGEVFLSIQNLPTLSEGQQYQLWAVTDENPVDLGLFDVRPDILRMADVSHASAFAVTVEPGGGSVEPTLATAYLIGKTGI